MLFKLDSSRFSDGDVARAANGQVLSIIKAVEDVQRRVNAGESVEELSDEQLAAIMQIDLSDFSINFARDERDVYLVLR